MRIRLACWKAGALATGLMAAASVAAANEDRIIWFSIGEGLTTAANVDAAINFAVANNYNGICVLARYRANAYYVPNRLDATDANNEPRASSSFDTLQYTIDKGREQGLRIWAAWSLFLVTDNTNTYPAFMPAGGVHWVYSSAASQTTYSPTAGFPRASVAADTGDGLWVDPAIPAIADYNRAILRDFVRNYDVDGIVLDRVRYPGDTLPRNTEAWGYNPTGIAAMQAAYPDLSLPTNPPPGASSFIDARRRTISDFVTNATNDVRAIKPWVIMGAAPVVFGSNLTDTYSTVYQHFPTWNSAPNAGHVSGFGNLDALMPQLYRTTAATNDSLMGLINADIDEVNRMLHTPIFQSYLEASGTSAPKLAENICDMRERNLDGFGVFSYDSLAAAGYQATLNATNTTSCGTGVLSSATPPAEYPLKVGWDSIKPNNITTLAASNQTNKIRVTWSTPPAAGDGDVPTRYLVYRSTSLPVRLYWANLVNKDFDVLGTTFIDSGATGLATGNWYYRVVPVDEYNNKADSNVVGPVSVTIPTTIVESRSGGQNFAAYSEVSGDWNNSTTKSTAPGVSGAAIGSRFCTMTTRNDVVRFSPTTLATGTNIYDVAYTTNNFSSTDAPNATWRVTTATGIVSGTFDVTAANTGNQWRTIGRFELDSTTARLEVDSSTVTTTTVNDRLPTDAVRFSFVSGSTDADADGLPDFFELTNAEKIANPGLDLTNSQLPDTDGDGILDGQEAPSTSATTLPQIAATNPLDRDTDGDGWNDRVEVLHPATFPNGPLIADTAGLIDTDGDGLPNSLEGTLGTNSGFADTDGDGWRDAYEVERGSSPTNPASTPTPPLGDVDGDGALSAADVTLFGNVATGLAGYTVIGNGDVNRDGVVTGDDATPLPGFVVGNSLLP